ncbi:MAG: hypothetical protein ACK5U7_08290 [Bacteroidota bacterium]|jgi:hypothetical protein
MAGRNQNFSIDFDKAVDVAMKDAEAIYSLGADMMFNSIIVGKDAPDTVVSHSGTPVDTGFARASWWKAIGGVGSHPNQPAKGETVSAPLHPLGKLKFSDKAYLANNAPYILALEYGHSKQAGDGMIRITLEEAPRFWELAKKRLATARANR